MKHDLPTRGHQPPSGPRRGVKDTKNKRPFLNVDAQTSYNIILVQRTTNLNKIISFIINHIMKFSSPHEIREDVGYQTSSRRSSLAQEEAPYRRRMC